MPPVKQIRNLVFNKEEIGMGFNSETGLAVGTALEGFTIPDPVFNGQQVFSSISIINSHEELMESLGMSFEASGRYGLASGSLKAKFSESSNYNSTSTFLVAGVTVQNPISRGKNFKVSDTAKALLNANRFDEFKRAFGDSFVRGLQTGGEFYAVIRITSVNSSQQSKLSLGLEAEFNGLAAAGSFKTSFINANSKEETKSEYHATMYQCAGSGPEISPTVEISEVLARFKAFPAIAKASAFPYETEVATYDTLPLPTPPLEEQENFLFAIRDARNQKMHFIQAKNDLQFADRNPEFFENLPAKEDINKAIQDYTKLINAVMDHASALSTGQIKPPKIFDPDEHNPPLHEPDGITLQRKVGAPPTPPPPTGKQIDPKDFIVKDIKFKPIFLGKVLRKKDQ
ncbi:hypothetical protein [Neobacillus vireti]|uniref:Uncharacterized protein n=1 Tax=Neobacillus vireti LMG 21834 TaxID=1131730 RepID=A0AB94IQM9_9BACI|nr:hypothetical protein [Neobacillus vireti]ETI69401.1 hypothetical protein BAVI_07451 [Neobacillus vireti LMG 21834]